MFDKEEVFYQNEDYTVRMKKIDGIERYYIKFNMTDSPESEISLDIFMLYYDRFRKPLDKQRNGSRRHIVRNNPEYHVLTNYAAEDEDITILKCDIEAVLKTCTPIQQRRVKLYYIQDYSIKDIAEMEKSDIAAVSRSITAAEKKIKKYFLG